MTSPAKFTLRLVLFGVVLLTLAGLFFLDDSPLRQKFDRAISAGPESISRANGVVAQVQNQTITRSQLVRAVRERLWHEGKSVQALPPAQRKTMLLTTLDDLIDRELLRIETKVHAQEFPVSPETLASRMQCFTFRFASPEEMRKVIAAQGIPDESHLRDRLTVEIQQENYLESRIRPHIMVSEKEVRDWFEQHPESAQIPERIKVRHIFIATLQRPEAEAKQRLDAALNQLLAKQKNFQQLSAELNEDEAAKPNSGDLGWMTRLRLPEDFAHAVFSMPVGKPSLVRTRIGWHLAEVTDRKPRESQNFADCRQEITATLEAVKRQQAVQSFKSDLRQAKATSIQIFHEMLDDLL